MLKTLSLNENHRFRALYGRGKSKAGRYMVVYCLRVRSADNINRLGITVSKKLGHAVTRNRVRRRIREAYRLSELLFKSGYDVVIVARHGSDKAPFEALRGELVRLFGELGMLSNRDDSHA